MFIDGSIHQLPDIDRAETREWLESLDYVLQTGGPARVMAILAKAY